jgi:hypothetical protein
MTFIVLKLGFVPFRFKFGPFRLLEKLFQISKAEDGCWKILAGTALFS